MQAEARQVLLDVQLVGDSIIGRASTGEGADREFTGWLGLLAVLQAMLAPSEDKHEELGR